MSRFPTSTLATALAVALLSHNELFKQFMKAYLENQVTGQTEIDIEPRKQLFKARFPNLYYGNLHMDCYQFCQQCKDHFETAGAKRPNRILFAALFLRVLGIFQYKRGHDGAVPMIWVESKNFL